MQEISPFEFRKRFAISKSIAIVGNAPTIMDHENGAKIDSFDLVVRFNRATTLGLETKIGSRTDILVVNANNSLDRAPSPAETVKPKCVVLFISPRGVPGANLEAFSQWVGDLPILIAFGPDLFGVPGGDRQRPLTSGTYVLHMLMGMLQPKRLFVTGFTMFGAVGGPAKKYYDDPRGSVGHFHDIDVEQKIFSELLSRFSGDLVLTSDVQDLCEGVKTKTTTGVGGKVVTRIADGLSWRMIRFGLQLRRIAEGKASGAN
ncbi:glycosyltransferase family 29 protein [Planctomycetes bacterium TBK1r]|uniref:beta-galactoside alpha-(2,6)-sialyltransferase n=1 Tax=Stieleria magnilauensis TaxID=2527963 RepID=A0ABX5XLN9_9BACT|nr:Glycosyltransferase family 29 (sialyltransferase) [Planctomycetes bacterium TBK1r]